MDQIRGLLQQYVGDQGSQDSASEDFDQVAQSAPRSSLASGLASALGSGDTPPFAQIASQLFNNSNGDQKAGLLNHLVSAIGPALASQLGGGSSGLAGLLGGGGQVTPDQAQSVSSDDVAALASHAQDQDPSVIDRVSELYAQHPDVVKSLGGNILSTVMSHMGQLGG